jgi:hypothetical protein
LNAECNLAFIGRQPDCGNFLQSLQIFRPDVLKPTLGETENKDRTACSTIRKDGPVTTGTTPPCSRNALLDKSGTKIAIYQATLRAGDSFAQAGVWDILASNEPNHPLGQEYLRSGFITL